MRGGGGMVWWLVDICRRRIYSFIQRMEWGGIRVCTDKKKYIFQLRLISKMEMR